MKTFVCTLLAAAAVLGATVSEARSRDDSVVTTRIAYGDLDLSKPQGRAALDRRVDVAARELCPVLSMTDPYAQAKQKACRNQVRESVHQKIASLLDRRAERGESPLAN